MVDVVGEHRLTGASGRIYEVRTSRDGVDYIRVVLKQKKTVSTQAVFWKISRKTHEPSIGLRLGRYKGTGRDEIPAQSDPKSVLTLDNDEFEALVDFISDNHKPLREGARHYVVLGEDSSSQQIEAIKAVFANPDREALIGVLSEHQIVPDDLRRMLNYRARCEAVERFERMLDANLVEDSWQTWFEVNDWVLGSEFVQIIDERRIDVQHVADYLLKGYDGFVDLVEIKRPEGHLRFWADKLDHGNYIPHQDLIKAITQASRYLFEVEREAATVKFEARIGAPTVKPRCTLIFGRSDDWNDEQREAYRILNAGLHNLSILTFDHVLLRARRMLGLPLDGKEIRSAPNP
jgi:hypothetical protein